MQRGSAILMLLIILTLTSMSSIVLLKVHIQFIKQVNLARLSYQADELLADKIAHQSAQVLHGTDFTVMPVIQDDSVQIGNQLFSINQTLDAVSAIGRPLSGYSLNSLYHSRILLLQTSATSALIRPPEVTTGFGCVDFVTGDISNQIDTHYPIDFDMDSVIDVSYTFNSAEGTIFKTRSSTMRFFNVALSADQRFTRPDFVQFNTGQLEKLAVIFIVETPSSDSGTVDNTLFILFDSPIVADSARLPININDLVNVQTNPTFNLTSRGYLLNLGQGALTVTALTTINRQVHLIVQSPVTDPLTGTAHFENQYIQLSLNANRAIEVARQLINSSPDLLKLHLYPGNNQDMVLSSQHGPITVIPGECRHLYQYEINGI